MAPHGDAIVSSYTFSRPPRLSSDGLKRTVSEMPFEFTKDKIDINSLTTIAEVVDAKCECCGMVEECTPEYMEKVHNRFLGKWICGLCSEAVNEEMEKNGGNKEEAVSSHMNTCVRFNKRDRAFPVLCQAEAMRNMLKKTRLRATSLSPRDHGLAKKGGIARSSSCIPAITKEVNDVNTH
ncbi:hypothetical protein HanXRQr2_Chr09g0415761 [Helianthus annuus]|uniref:DUF1677 family protein n=1 Tax=Helianthus annuus TaxID=4232 RepID=A0A251U0G1_HELAN|nr:uncharacterized protein LOC110880168 [Helianthus annuus]KAF5793287.1 hypothetical protein HanXRQr2_Chr09g0415761 [Helianthus annuus]KAJ0528128.1 hypothetical protein HanHA300_Chr09g0341761 [Helianthus annuus]KAJ0537007.1 hypothetical protein HanIR_Chr09g0447971 [Helianthus annuus]KAJ0544561.1 hypothetical protein HanHA89_Chr09g0363021 [Helianthus annuus]